MTKAADIIALHKQGKSTREIALAVSGEATDAKMAYVRVVTRQRIDGKASKWDESWMRRRYKARSLTEAYRNASRERYADPVRYRQFLDYQSAYKRRRRLSAAPESG